MGYSVCFRFSETKNSIGSKAPLAQATGAFVLTTTMSKKILELTKLSQGAIIGIKGGVCMDNSKYTQDLEKLVQKLLPYYHRYYDLIGAVKPPLEEVVIQKAVKKQPALFRPK